jgi:hypothetical protein
MDNRDNGTKRAKEPGMKAIFFYPRLFCCLLVVLGDTLYCLKRCLHDLG